MFARSTACNGNAYPVLGASESVVHAEGRDGACMPCAAAPVSGTAAVPLQEDGTYERRLLLLFTVCAAVPPNAYPWPMRAVHSGALTVERLNGDRIGCGGLFES